MSAVPGGQTVLPMFPLGMVLLPGAVLPLHVFEPRYRQMIIDLLQSDDAAEFGQALITHGRETGGDDVRAEVGTVARITEMAALDDGRYALVTVGTRRIRVREWLPDDPYPRATVEDWPDEDEADFEAASFRTAVAALEARIRGVLEMAIQLGDLSAEGTAVLEAPPLSADVDPTAASHILAARSPIGEADRYRLLCAAGPAERIGVLGEVLDDVEAMLRFRLS